MHAQTCTHTGTHAGTCRWTLSRRLHSFQQGALAYGHKDLARQVAKFSQIFGGYISFDYGWTITSVVAHPLTSSSPTPVHNQQRSVRPKTMVSLWLTQDT